MRSHGKCQTYCFPFMARSFPFDSEKSLNAKNISGSQVVWLPHQCMPMSTWLGIKSRPGPGIFLHSKHIIYMLPDPVCMLLPWLLLLCSQCATMELLDFLMLLSKLFNEFCLYILLCKRLKKTVNYNPFQILMENSSLALKLYIAIISVWLDYDSIGRWKSRVKSWGSAPEPI